MNIAENICVTPYNMGYITGYDQGETVNEKRFNVNRKEL